MTGFSDEQLAALRAPLAREHVKGRQQAGRTLSYVEGWHVITEANRIFGFDAWDRETVECHSVSEQAAKLGPMKDRDGWRVAYVGKVRVTVRAGERVIIREGTGYGSGIDADNGAAHESAAKECETDALKRALMTFGNPFGLALYDKAQAEVEPVAGRRPVPPTSPMSPAYDTNATYPPAPPANGHAAPAARAADPDRKAKHDRAVEARDRIRAAIDGAAEPQIVDDIVKVNGADLDFIREFHAPTYENLIARVTARITELRASA